jgi:uncharacterized radical SAM superfamily Fe-S cluster-containing enzyme
MVRFAADNFDIVKFLVFQPVSFSGRIDLSKLKEMRVTNSDVMRLVEEQTGGEIKKTDFFTLPMNQAMAKIMVKGGQNQDFCVHPHCGLITVVEKEKGKLVPVSRYIQNEKVYDRVRGGFEAGWSQPRLMRALATSLLTNVHPKLWPKLAPILFLTKDSRSIRSLLTKWLPQHFLTIGIMHFMDPYNFDLDRVENCGLHFGVIGNDSKPRLIPFCSMNSLHRVALSSEGKGQLEEAKTGSAAGAGKRAS